jgi:LAS superfamily LD-carboxypeptidase LdcB
VTDTASVEAALPAVTSAQDAAAAALRDAVLALAQQAAQVSTAADAATAQAAAAASAAQKAAWKVSLQGYANGRIPASALCAPSFDASALLRCDATEAIDQLDAAFAQAFGHHLTLNDSYRSYAAQVQCTRTRGWLCATPGTSNHGLGIAVDIGDATSYSSAAYAWLTANGPAFGWHNPAWALPSGYKHEPWHWEYVG